MLTLSLLFAGLFLPLFPLSMVFNELFDRIRDVRLRIALLLIWPQIGIVVAHTVGIELPGWIIFWALLTAVLYGVRALALRDVGLWTSFIATSAWAVLWVTVDNTAELSQLVFYAVGFSAPLALLVLLSNELENRFGAAYTGLYGGLALTLPRLSGVLVMVVLAIIATPLFPAFSAMLATIIDSAAHSFTTAITVGGIWLLWSWAGTRLLHGLIIGPAHEESTADLSLNAVWLYTAILGLLAISGIYSIGYLS